MRRLRLIVFLTTATLLLFAIPINVNAAPTSGGGIAVNINGEEITRKEFGDFLILAYGDVALDFMIKKLVVEQEARKNKVTVTQEELDARLERNANIQINLMMQKQGLTNKEDLELSLFRQGMTLNKLKSKIIASIKNQVGVELAVEKILEKDIVYTEEDLMEAYDDKFGAKFQARQIVLKTRKKAGEVLRKLSGGAEFDKLAKEESIDRASAARGGAMIPFGVHTTLGRSVSSLKNGEYSDIIETGYGYHIIQLMDKTPGSKKSFEDVIDQLEVFVKMEKLSMKTKPWLRALFEKAKIEILL